jgi:chemotaxis-related protein WspB
MKLVVFEAGGSRYGVPVEDVVMIAPRVPLRPLPQAPPGIPGVMRLLGALVPVVDLGVLLGGAPTATSFSSRIVVVTCTRADGTPRRLGLLAHQMTDLQEIADDAFASAGVTTPESRGLGDLAPAGPDLLQVVRPCDLLTPDVREALFAEADRDGSA